MARNRMIKPEFWTSKNLSKISMEANLLFIGLWNYCDDYGVYLFSKRKILGDIFPLRDKITENNIEKWTNELVSIGVIKFVNHKETEYIIISNWSEHQKVPNPNKRRWLEEQIQSSLDTNESLISISLDPKVPKGKGEGENRGKEKEYSSEFLSFWDATHKTGNKRKAFEAFEKRLEEYSFEEIGNAFIQLNEDKKGSEIKYWPQVTTFLNSMFEGYLDRSKGVNPMLSNKENEFESFEEPF